MRSLMESVVLRRLEGSVDSDAFPVPPQPVHITQGDVEGKAVIVSWVTQEAPRTNTVLYWREQLQKASSPWKIQDILCLYAYYGWHKNQDGYAVKGDTPADDSSFPEHVGNSLHYECLLLLPQRLLPPLQILDTLSGNANARFFPGRIQCSNTPQKEV